MSRLDSFSPAPRLTRLAFACALALTSNAAQARLEIRLQGPTNPDDALSDPTAAEAVGSNTASSLGEQRWRVLEAAAEAWASRLSSPTPIVVAVSMPELPCGTLGGAQSGGYITDAAGLDPEQVYSLPLAERLAGESLNGDEPDVVLELNGASCADGPNFYLGLDAPAPDGQQSLLNVAAHELAHALGFESLVNPSDGQALYEQPGLDPFSRHLYDVTLGQFWYQLSAQERALSATTPRSVVWIGAHVSAVAKQRLASGSAVLEVPELPQLSGILTAPTSAAEFEAIATTVISILPNSACEAIVEAPGQIVLAAEGDCSPAALAQVGHDAGALAVLEVEAGGQLPAPSFASRELSSDPPLVIPVFRIGQTDGQLLADAEGVTIALGWDSKQRAGADRLGRPYLYTPSKPVLGQSLSHWDSSLSPSALLEPVPARDLSLLDIELELAVLRDLGWAADDSSLDAGSPNAVPDAGEQLGGGESQPGDAGGLESGAAVADAGQTVADAGQTVVDAGHVTSLHDAGMSGSDVGLSHADGAVNLDSGLPAVNGEGLMPFDAARHEPVQMSDAGIDTLSTEQATPISENCGCSVIGANAPKSRVESLIMGALLVFAARRRRPRQVPEHGRARCNRQR